jgi:hypothetical protein
MSSLSALATGYPNRFRAGNAASSMWAAQNGDPNNFGAGYNPYIGGRKLMSQQAVQEQQNQGTWVGTDAPSFNAASMGWYQGECIHSHFGRCGQAGMRSNSSSHRTAEAHAVASSL